MYGVLWQQKENSVTFPHCAQRKHTYLGEIKQMSKTKKLAPRKKVYLEFLHQILGHRSTRSLIVGDTDNFWEDIELRIYPDPFCTSFQISSMKKKARSKNILKPKAPLWWFFMDIIPATAPKSLKSDTNFSNCL